MKKDEEFIIEAGLWILLVLVCMGIIKIISLIL
jgi:hypothetical protein